MEFSASETYEADVATAFALFQDAEATVARAESLGHKDAGVLANEASPDGGWVIRSKRTVPLELPGFAKKVLKPNNLTTQTDTWGPEVDGRREGTFVIEVQGAPMRVSGTMRLDPTDDGRATQSVKGDVEVKVPLIGGKIAAWAVGDAQKALEGELAFNKRWIEDHRR